MSQADHNKGEQDGAAYRKAEKKDWFGSIVGDLTGNTNYKPPSDKARKEDYDKGFKKGREGR